MPPEKISEDSEGNLVVSTPLLTKLDSIQREQAAGFAGLREALDSKVDKADMAKIEGRIEEHTRQIGELQTWKHDRQVAAEVHRTRNSQIFSGRQKFWAAVGVVVTACALILGPVIAAVLH